MFTGTVRASQSRAGSCIGAFLTPVITGSPSQIFTHGITSAHHVNIWCKQEKKDCWSRGNVKNFFERYVGKVGLYRCALRDFLVSSVEDGTAWSSGQHTIHVNQRLHAGCEYTLSLTSSSPSHSHLSHVSRHSPTFIQLFILNSPSHLPTIH